MAETNQIRLSESQTTGLHEADSSEAEQRAADPEQTDPRQVESNRTKLSVLIGSGIIQVPIWGKFGHTIEI